MATHRLSLRFAIALAAVAAGLVACDSLTGPEPPNRTAFHAAPLAGIDISEHPDGFGVVGTTPNLWLAHPGERCGTLVYYGSNPELMLRLANDQYVPITHSELTTGMDVELWIPSGTLVESTCPGQISPSHIVVSAPR